LVYLSTFTSNTITNKSHKIISIFCKKALIIKATKDKFLSFLDKIVLIQIKFKESLISEHNKHSLLIGLWKNYIIELYNYYKSMKTKRGLIASKKIFSIKDSVRDSELKLLLQHSMIEYVQKYLLWKRSNSKKKMIQNFQKVISNENESISPQRSYNCENVSLIHSKKTKSSNMYLKAGNEIKERENNSGIPSKITTPPCYIFIPSKEKFIELILNAAGLNNKSPKSKLFPHSFTKNK